MQNQLEWCNNAKLHLYENYLTKTANYWKTAIWECINLLTIAYVLT